MRTFTKTLTILILITAVSVSSGWLWGKKKEEDKKAKSDEPVVEESAEKCSADKEKSEKKKCDKKEKNTCEEKTEAKAVEAKSEEAKKAEKPKAEKDTQEEEIKKIELKPADKPVDPNKTVVTVNGEEIKEATIQEKIEAQLARAGGKIPPQMKDQYKSRIRSQLIEQMVIETLLEQKIQQKGLAATDAEVQSEIEAQIAQQDMSMDDFKALLSAYGKDFDEYKENIKKKVKFEKLLESEMSETADVNETQAREFYESNPQRFEQPESVNTRHILISTESDDPNADPNVIAVQAKEKAEEILKKVKAGEDFGELAKEYSSCPSGQKGGELGMAPKGSFVPAFEEAAYALEPNEISDVVKTQFGYHIIQLIEHQGPNTTSFAEAKPEIIQMLENQQKRDEVMEYIKKIKDQAEVEYTNPADKMPARPMGRPRPRRAPAGKGQNQ